VDNKPKAKCEECTLHQVVVARLNSNKEVFTVKIDALSDKIVANDKNVRATLAELKAANSEQWTAIGEAEKLVAENKGFMKMVALIAIICSSIISFIAAKVFG
jgi:hypothetical protein